MSSPFPASIQPVEVGRPSFLNLPRCLELEALAADVAVIGIPFTQPASLSASRSPCSGAPAALRAESERYADTLDGVDFDLGGELLDGRSVSLVDCGDVAMQPGQYAANARRAEAVVAYLDQRRGLPLVLGGDQAATIPVVRALGGHGRLGVIQFSAELHWRDVEGPAGESECCAMRRVAELPWVVGSLHVGLRGGGGASSRDVADALASNARLVRAEELRHGVDGALALLPDADAYYLSLNLGALDPSLAPAVESPAFGGLDYQTVLALLRGFAARGPIVGIDVVGLVPDRDSARLTAQLGARLSLVTLGLLAHAGQLGRQTSEPIALTAETRQGGRRA